jgi:AmiR/NasT family two-component response regulator
LLIRDEKSYFDIDKDVRNQISAINEEAQILQNKVILMARYHTSANDIIEQINRDVYMIERERQLRRVGEI